MTGLEAETAARAAKQHYILQGLPVATWSATMPAYAGTSLCPVKEMRERGEAVGKRVQSLYKPSSENGI